MGTVLISTLGCERDGDRTDDNDIGRDNDIQIPFEHSPYLKLILAPAWRFSQPS